jgi:O-methyltransferase involved in polyketide biosynthesis
MSDGAPRVEFLRLPSLDVSRPHPARMYNYWLGGKDNFQADRDAAEYLLTVVPDGLAVARANRDFALRATRYMAARGIRQFLDLGSGLPARPAVHEIAQHYQRAARVVYVDCDPIVASHNHALSGQVAGVGSVQADIRDPRAMLAHSALTALIDPRQPTGLLCAAVMHFVAADDPAAIISALRGQLAPGSILALSHITSDGTRPEIAAEIEETYRETAAPAIFRTEAEISAIFGSALVPPGLVPVSSWRPSLAPGRRPTGKRLPTNKTLRVVGGVAHFS